MAPAQPLFVLGPARAGTTFAARLLNSHPQILLTNEIAVFLLLDQLVANVQKGCAAGIEYPKEREQEVAEFFRSHARTLVLDLYGHIALGEGKRDLRYWGDKHPHYCNCLDFVYQCFPEARFVFLVRDPRDVACSLAEVRGVSLAEALRDWSIFQALYGDFFQRHPEVPTFWLRYEDLVLAPEETLQRLFSWLQLAWPAPEVLAFLHRHRFTDAHQLFSPQPGSVEGRQLIGRWQALFGPEELALTQELCGEFLARWGYTRHEGMAEVLAPVGGTLGSFKGLKARWFRSGLRWGLKKGRG